LAKFTDPSSLKGKMAETKKGKKLYFESVCQMKTKFFFIEDKFNLYHIITCFASSNENKTFTLRTNLHCIITCFASSNENKAFTLMTNFTCFASSNENEAIYIEGKFHLFRKSRAHVLVGGVEGGEGCHHRLKLDSLIVQISEKRKEIISRPMLVFFVTSLLKLKTYCTMTKSVVKFLFGPFQK
jgi:hypothetical protein